MHASKPGWLKSLSRTSCSLLTPSPRSAPYPSCLAPKVALLTPFLFQPLLPPSLVVCGGVQGRVSPSLLVTLPCLFSPDHPPPEHFLYQATAECYFQSNGSEAGSGPTSPPPPPRVRFLERFFYDRQEFLRFDSDRGEYEAVTSLGEPDAQSWNSRREILDHARRAADYFCRHNYEGAERIASGRKSKQVPGGRASGAGGSCGAGRQPPPDKGREGK